MSCIENELMDDILGFVRRDSGISHAMSTSKATTRRIFLQGEGQASNFSTGQAIPRMMKTVDIVLALVGLDSVNGPSQLAIRVREAVSIV